MEGQRAIHLTTTTILPAIGLGKLAHENENVETDEI